MQGLFGQWEKKWKSLIIESATFPPLGIPSILPDFRLWAPESKQRNLSAHLTAFVASNF
jgi:hypothetical protein